ncbi:MAG TPA: pyroglutamyl-peptidase I [Xanthobacteraceae bacterium]|nr:pyroglutamyl-peptidase I [Xanthobacteraceae bacterium]
MPLTLLITGFGPFPGAPTNPSGPLAKRLARRRRPVFADTRLFAHVFRTSYAAVERELPALLTQYRPDAVLMFGLATRTPHLRIEIRARNVASMMFADAERRKPAARLLTRSGVGAMAVRAPRANLLQAARAARVPVRLSHDAGRYLCNALFWRALEAADQRKGPRVVAFVHVPRLRRNLSLADLARGGEAITAAILATARRPH